MANQQFYNTGYFLPTNYSWNIQQVQSSSLQPETKELLVQLYQNIGNICLALNAKDTAQYMPYEYVTGQQYYNPANNNNPRPGFRVAIDFGALPNTTSKSVAHTIPFGPTYTFISISGAATDPVNLLAIPITFGSSTANESIKIVVDTTNITITTARDYSAYTRCMIVLEYIKN